MGVPLLGGGNVSVAMAMITGLVIFAIASCACVVLTGFSARADVQAAHEISVELETTVGVRSEEELLWGCYWCRYGVKQIWAQARIVVPLCLYVAAFKDGLLHGRSICRLRAKQETDDSTSPR